MSEKRDYYEVLGVARDADQRTIKRAFLKKAREVHPDVNKSAGAEEQFKELNEAYSVLSDEQKRANYDRFGTADGPGMGSGYVDISDIFGGMGVDDIFSSFFGGGAAGGGSRGTRAAACGAVTWPSRSASPLRRRARLHQDPSATTACPLRGLFRHRTRRGASEKQCARCHGTGYVTTVQRSIFGQMQSSSPCPDCNGEGTVIDHPCDMCDGQGRTPVHEKLDVDIPAGISTGRQLRLSGYGEAGYRGAASGDLIVNVQVAEHARFTRQGDDLVADVHVSIAQAALGCTIEVAGILPDERFELEVPAGTQYGGALSVSGHGMPRLGGGTQRGRFVGKIVVDVPTSLSAEQRAALERYADAADEDVARKRTVGDRIRDAIDDMLD